MKKIPANIHHNEPESWWCNPQTQINLEQTKLYVERRWLRERVNQKLKWSQIPRNIKTGVAGMEKKTHKNEV